MRFVILNGSPKGDKSITLQYVRFAQKKYPNHEFLIYHISQCISKLEKKSAAFHEVIRAIDAADGIFWIFPIYAHLVPFQYKRFIELIWERKVTGAFNGKYTTVVSTSVHFYDHTAHRYMNAICDDLSMKFFNGFSADMYDLLKKTERERFEKFIAGFFNAIQNSIPSLRNNQPLVPVCFDYNPGDSQMVLQTGEKRIVIVHDVQNLQSNAGKMIRFFQEKFANKLAGS